MNKNEVENMYNIISFKFETIKKKMRAMFITIFFLRFFFCFF